MRRTSITKIGLCIALAFTVASAGCIVVVGDGQGDNLRGKAKRTDQVTAAVGGASVLKVTSNVGAIKVDAAATTEVHITVDITVKAKTDEQAEALLEGVRITAEPSGDTFVVRAEKPSGFGRNQLNVDFTITAPAGLRLECTNNVGDIRIDGFAGRVETHTDVGAITCNGLRDGTSLHTNVGDIRAAYSPDAPAALDVSVSTNVGNIDFTGPSQISANLTAAANVGDIHTHRPLTVSGSLGKSVRASLGAAEGQVDLRTNVGSITIR
jgi:hypothetical protein